MCISICCLINKKIANDLTYDIIGCGDCSVYVQFKQWMDGINDTHLITERWTNEISTGADLFNTNNDNDNNRKKE